MAAAEATGVANVSLYEKSGPMAYDGWAGVGGDLTQGDPPLVVKERGSRYKLSTVGGDDAGKAVASALHAKAHQRGWCGCGRRLPPFPRCAWKRRNRPCRRCTRRLEGRECARAETRRAPPPPRSASPPRRRSTAPPTPPTTASTNERARGRRRSPVPDDDSDDSVLGFSPPRPPRPPATPASSIMDLTTPRVPPRPPGDARASLGRVDGALLERHEPLVGGVGRRRLDAVVDAAAGARRRRRLASIRRRRVLRTIARARKPADEAEAVPFGLLE